ncbi:MAG TPA: hypothetical protein VN947_09210 [Polyangia bacterium]|nr:hypothetical protein [Polyangia bacterium]
MDTTTTTKPKTKLPVVLEQIRVATPCSADWDDMVGDERVRFCGKCEKNVYNLSAMTRDAGEALVREKEGRLCVRLYQRLDGTVITADCPVGVKRARLRARIWARITGATASAALLLGLWGGRARADLAVDGKKPTNGQKQQPPANVRVMGGAVAVTPPPPEKHLMGKIAVAPSTPKPEHVVQGEPAPIMGDVAVVEPPPAPKHETKKNK